MSIVWYFVALVVLIAWALTTRLTRGGAAWATIAGAVARHAPTSARR